MHARRSHDRNIDDGNPVGPHLIWYAKWVGPQTSTVWLPFHPSLSPNEASLSCICASRALKGMNQVAPTASSPSTTCAVVGARSGREFQVQVVDADVDAHLSFSYMRALWSLVGMLMFMTDIPRSGLGTQAFEASNPTVAPNTVMFFGPYAYHNVRIELQEGTVINGSCDDAPVDTTGLWSYKYDTLSIAPRALATQLSVAAYPACVLYREECNGSDLALSTAFAMLDGLVTALEDTYSLGKSSERRHPGINDQIHQPSVAVGFRTHNNWVDRLHHYVYQPLWIRADHRLHHAFVYHASQTDRLELCMPRPGRSIDPTPLPNFCDHPIVWTSRDPRNRSRRVPIWQHIDLRLAHLQTQYANCSAFDVTVLTTQVWRSNHRQLNVLPAIAASMDSLEYTTIIRGRQCSDLKLRRNCSTIVVDDYRYERASLEDNASDLFYLTATLRVIGQVYGWLRLVLFVSGSYYARSAEFKNATGGSFRRLFVTITTVLRVPSQVIIYGSWVPILAYSAAHFVDCARIHFIADIKWSAVQGLHNFKFWTYVNLASIQMRNVWLVALAYKLFMLVQVYVLSRYKQLQRSYGILTLRGELLGLVSTLSIFASMRSPRFRNVNILDVYMLDRPLDWARQRRMMFEERMEVGCMFDIKTLVAASTLVLAVAMAVKLALTLIRSQGDLMGLRRCWGSYNMMFLRTHYVPYSAGSLWAADSIGTFWRLRKKRTDVTSGSPWLIQNAIVAPAAPSVADCSLGPSLSLLILSRHCPSCDHKRFWNWYTTQGCVQHDHIFRVEARTPDMWAITQLINLAMMTDPLVLFTMYVSGAEVRVLQAPGKRKKKLPKLTEITATTPAATRATPPRFFLVPCSVDDVDAEMSSLRPDNLTSPYVVVDEVDSRTLPWTMLLCCG